MIGASPQSRILDALPYGVIVLNGSLELVRSNAAADAPSILAIPTILDICRRVLAAGSAETVRVEVSGKSFEVTVSPARPGVVLALQDVTDRSRLEAELHTLRTRLLRLLDSSIIGIATSTVDGVTYANDAFLRALGYTREDLEAGRADWQKVTPPDEIHKDMQALRELTDRGECTPFEKTYVHPDGTRVPVLIGAARINEDPLEWVAYVVDISARKQMEDALRVNRERLQLAAESGGIGAWDMDIQNAEVHADAQVCGMFGFANSRPSPNDWFSRIDPEDEPRVRQEFETAIADGSDYETEYRTIRDGVTRWVFAKGRVLRDRSGRPLRIVGIAQDITERRSREQQYQDAVRRLEFHMRNTPVAVIEYDSDLQIVRWGGEAEAIFGWTEAETVGKRLDELRWVHDDDAERVAAVAGELLTGKSRIRCENRNYRKDGGVVYMDWYNSASFGANGKLSSLLCLGIDVTPRVEAELSLQRLTRDLQASNQELQQFAYAVSHDLKEPLRSVSAFSELLRRRHSSALPADAIEIFSFIADGVQRMQRLINDLLEYSRVGQEERSHFASVNTEAALGFALSNLSQSIEETGAYITHDTLPELKGDPIRLCQLFQNLIGNAIKYRRPEQHPRIHISAVRDGAEWRFSVQDNGCGIEARYREQVFGVFKRLHGRDIPGSGVGLAIAKRIVERHGGRIWVESEPGAGSTFYFTIATERQTESTTCAS